MFFKKMKEDIKFLEDELDSQNNLIQKANKTLRILIEQLESHADGKVKEALGVLRKTLQYWG